jgi:hypothetical protein
MGGTLGRLPKVLQEASNLLNPMGVKARPNSSLDICKLVSRGPFQAPTHRISYPYSYNRGRPLRIPYDRFPRRSRSAAMPRLRCVPTCGGYECKDIRRTNVLYVMGKTAWENPPPLLAVAPGCLATLYRKDPPLQRAPAAPEVSLLSPASTSSIPFPRSG